METAKKKSPLFKKLGITSIALCGLCCALPIIGAVAGIGSLTAIAFYLEKIGIIALGLTGVFLAYYIYQKRQEKKSCSTSCDVDCGCKTDTATKN